MPEWLPNGEIISKDLSSGQRLLIPVAHDEYTFHSNDGIHQCWIYQQKIMIRKKP
jgi:hypothetical protein